MRSVVLLIAVAACAHADPSPATAPVATPAAAAPIARPEACGADAMACVRDRLAACRGPHRAWKVSTRMLDTPMTLTVSDTGAAMVDTMGVAVRTANAQQALDCLDTCPTAQGPASVCFALDFPIKFEIPVPAGCDLTGVEGPPWRGHASRSIHCNDLEATFVPDLRGVRDALVDAGVFRPDSAPARVDGLLVRSEQLQALEWTTDDVAEVPCAALALPAGARVMTGADDLTTARAAAPPALAALQRAVQPLMQQLLEDKMKPAMQQAIGEACLGKRDHYDQAEVDACAKAHPDRVAPEKVRRDLMEKLIPDLKAMLARTELPRLMRQLVEEPVCRAVVDAHAQVP